MSIKRTANSEDAVLKMLGDPMIANISSVRSERDVVHVIYIEDLSEIPRRIARSGTRPDEKVSSVTYRYPEEVTTLSGPLSTVNNRLDGDMRLVEIKGSVDLINARQR